MATIVLFKAQSSRICDSHNISTSAPCQRATDYSTPNIPFNIVAMYHCTLRGRLVRTMAGRWNEKLTPVSTNHSAGMTANSWSLVAAIQTSIELQFSWRASRAAGLRQVGRYTVYYCGQANGRGIAVRRKPPADSTHTPRLHQTSYLLVENHTWSV